MKKKQVIAVSSALMIGTTTALTGFSTPVMAQENTEIVQEIAVEDNKTEQIPGEHETENTETTENTAENNQEETASENASIENADTSKEEAVKEENAMQEAVTAREENTGTAENSPKQDGIIRVGNTDDANYTSLAEAVTKAADGDTIQIVSDIVETDTICIDKNLTIIGNSTTWSLSKTGTKYDQISLFTLNAGKKLTLGDGDGSHSLTLMIEGISQLVGVAGELTVNEGMNFSGIGPGAGGDNLGSQTVYINDGAKFIGNGGKFDNIELLIREGGKATIHGGTYKNNSSSGNAAVDIYGEVDEITGGTFINTSKALNVQGHVGKISGGTFTSDKVNGGAVHVQYTGHVDEISGGSFNNDKGHGLAIYTTGNDDEYPRVDKISGGVFTANYGIWLKSYVTKADGSPTASIGEISGGSFIGKTSGIEVDTFAGIDKITDGTIAGTYGILNIGKIGEIAGARIEGTGQNGIGLWNYPNEEAEVKQISGGTIIGGNHAVMNSTGKVDKISGGIFYGKTGNAYKNTGTNVTEIEPDLSASIGNARYWGGVDAIFQVNSNVIYPNGYHMSSRTTTLRVDDIEDTQFRYLKKFLMLSYDGNGGTGSMDSLTETTDGEEFTIKENQFQNEGMSFIEWNTEEDGSGISYHAGDKLTLSEDTTLYAQWKSAQNTVTFMNEDATYASVKVETGKAIDGDNLTPESMPNNPEKTGYTFKEWNTKKDGTGTKFTGDSIVDQDLTVFAVYSMNAVAINSVPIISANDVTLNVGDNFDPLSDVSATDKEDGDITLTKDNIIANDVDTSKAGIYHVTYKVTDKNGASAEKTITVTVKQKMEILNSVPTISANDVTLNVGDNFDPLSDVSATDKEDGDITLTKDNIIANNVDTSKAGIYHVTYKVTDKNGASAEKTITVTVKEKNTNKPENPQQTQKPNKPNNTIKPNGQTKTPKTGDMSNVGLFASMFAASTGALAVLFSKKRKRNKND